MTDLQHTRQQLEEQFDHLHTVEILKNLRNNPPGTLATLPDQWPVIRPLLLYMAKMSTDEVRESLLDYIAVSDEQLNYSGEAQEPETQPELKPKSKGKRS